MKLQLKFNVYIALEAEDQQQVVDEVAEPLHKAVAAAFSQVRAKGVVKTVLANTSGNIGPVDPMECLYEILMQEDLRGLVPEGELFNVTKAERSAPNN